MNLHLLWLISRYSFREIWRNRTLRIIFLILVPLIFAYQLSFQSNMFGIPMEYTFVLSSFIPAQNAYLFNLFLVFPLAIMGYWIHKRETYNTLEALFVYPQGNGTYIAGTTIGIASVFMLLGGISLALAGLINLIASPTAFRPFIYLFYWVTLFLPTILFIVGMASFLSACCFKNSSVTTLFMFVYLGVDILYLSKLSCGIFDPLGISLAYTFSDFTGIANLQEYLFHRMAFLLGGIGFVILAVSGFPRIPNKVRGCQLAVVIGISFFVMGVLSGHLGYNRHKQLEYHHTLYKSVYSKYIQKNKVDVLTHDIRFGYLNKRARMESRMTLQNNTAFSIPQIILYLNPSLSVTEIREDKASLSFAREAQAILITRALSPGDSMTLTISYQGTIDESICYLDVPEEQKRIDMDFRHYLSCRLGSRYAFLEDNYILLIPECLWYPVATPPVNPLSPYNTPADFTRYTLSVDHSVQFTAISQGVSKKIGSGTRFENKYPLRNISLCVGKYERKRIKVDSTTYELYMLPDNFEVLRSIEKQIDDLSGRIRDMKATIEQERKFSYPFNRLCLVEAPITFNSHYRLVTGGSEMVQPELLLFPERGIGILNGRIRPFAKPWLRFENSGRRNDLFKSVVYNRLNGEYCLGSHEEGGLAHLKLGTKWHSESIYNLLSFDPLFCNYAYTVFSSRYPAINGILSQIIKRTWENRNPVNSSLEVREKALDFLDGKSFREALVDEDVSFSVLNQINELKANDLLMQIMLRGVSGTDFYQFMENFITQNQFRSIDFQTFDMAFFERFGWQLSEIFPEYFDGRELPAFLVKNLRVKRILSPLENKENLLPWGAQTKFRLEFDVLNESDVDGIISLHLESFRVKSRTSIVDKTNFVVKSFAVKAREAKRIAFIHQGIFSKQSVHTGLSKNRPDMFYMEDETIIPNVKNMEITRDTSSWERSLQSDVFYPSEYEIIVDNKDAGFSITDPPAPRLKRLLVTNDEPDRFLENTTCWMSKVSADCFGWYCLSCVGKAAGRGKAYLTWNIPIQKKGYYRIYAYIPNYSYRVECQKSKWDKNYVKKDILYHFTISSPDDQQEIQVYAPEMSQWVFLEELELLPGDCSVTLYDTGIPGQCVVGDAIKWVYQK